ncbi:hypothetical protein [Flavobacterium sp.]|jgi:hypothetical protein|uniref:hypothetical protein n=1 Tax=Flavobacterium sp. TaxID=239 RepID=UPI002FDB7F03
MDLSRLPDNIPDNFRDADIDEALSDVKLWNKSISPEEERYRGNTVLRDNLAKVFTIVIIFWIVSVILILVGNNCNHYNLSDTVLVTLLTTTTVQVLGLVYIILKDLFPGGGNEINTNKTE